MKNWRDSPFLTAQLMCCERDLHLFPRSYGSIRRQTLDHRQIQVQILYDGELTAEQVAILTAEVGDHDFADVSIIETGRSYGYYCHARNQGLLLAWGFYIAFIDCDNEWRPAHLANLLTAIRTPTDEGWPHLTYARREYVHDDGAPDYLPTGPSPLREWSPENLQPLMQAAGNNFIDTGDFLIGVGTLYEAGERFGCVWNPEVRRFGDWDLIRRLASMGVRGRPVDAVTHIYHWHASNVQHTRRPTEMVALPADTYDLYKRQGLIK